METIELGGNIQLVGFSGLENSQLIVLKKIIGNYARKFADNIKGYEMLTLTNKDIHGKSKFEVHGKLMIAGKPVTSECTLNNVFMSVAEVMKKLETQTIKSK